MQPQRGSNRLPRGSSPPAGAASPGPSVGANDPSVHSPPEPPALPASAFTIYRVYDVGEEIDLAVAEAALARRIADRRQPSGVRQASSIQIAQPPLPLDLGAGSLAVGTASLPGTLRATIYDLGAVALALALPLEGPTSWATVAELFKLGPELPAADQRQFERAIEDLERALGPAIIRPRRSAIVEDYSILVVNGLTSELNVAEVAKHPLVWAAMLGEQRALSPDAARLVTKMSYYPDDLALLSWNGALLIDPDPVASATAVELIEFAQVELLLMRDYDADLDAQLPGMYRRISRPQRRVALPVIRGYGGTLHDIQRLIAEVTEVTERVDNALKVTDDVYWNRLYSALIAVLRVDVWRSGVEHKLALLRQTYGLLQDEAGAERALVLEVTIVLLIALEIALALLKA